MNKVVEQFQELNFSGDIIPHTWYETSLLRHDSGKPNMVAIALLANISYWYRPEVVIAEETNRVLGIKQKFSNDKLRMHYKQWSDKYGFTKRQVKDAIAFLKQRGLITVEFRTLKYNGLAISNVPFIEPVFEMVKAITLISARNTEDTRSNGGAMTIERHTPVVETSYPHRSNVRRISKITNKSTNKTTTKSTEEKGATACAVPPLNPFSSSSDFSVSASKPEKSFNEGKVSFEVEQAAAAGAASPTSGYRGANAAVSRKLKKNTRERATGAACAEVEKERDPNLEHPAVVAFRKFWKHYPDKEGRELIAAHVTNLKDWNESMRYWSTISQNWTNVRQQVRIYVTREFEQSIGYKNSSQYKENAPLTKRGQLARDAMLRLYKRYEEVGTAPNSDSMSFASLLGFGEPSEEVN